MNFSIIFSILLYVVVSVIPNRLSAEQDKPNIVFIITDDQSWDSLGFMGGGVHTPRIDRLANEGMYFTDFNVTSTVCSPSRYSFLTGRYAGRCEGPRFLKEHPPGDQTQVENIGELEPGGWNLAKILQQNGYRTGFVGKSHFIRHDWFDHPEDSPLETYDKSADPKDPKVNEKMQRNHRRWCDEIKGYGFDYADGVYAANLKELYNNQLNVHNLEWTVEHALEFLDVRDAADRPFFLYFSTTLHHGPAPWRNDFSLNADPRMTGEGFLADRPDIMPSRQDVLRRNREAGFQDRHAYALWLDDGIGAIVDKIAALGLAKDTLILFVPDHGAWRHGKATLHDFGMRVPLLARWIDKIKPGTRCDQLVANIDLAPTLMDLCGVNPPANYQFDGLSFRALLFGEDIPIRESLFGELGHSRCIKTKYWKYIAVRYPPKIQKRIDAGELFQGFFGEYLPRPYLTRNSHLGHYAAKANNSYYDADQLYDLVVDPEETKNIYQSNPDIVKGLAAALSKELTQFKNRPFGEFTN